MAFADPNTIQYRDWAIQQTWNDAKTQWDRVAVKGAQRIEQGTMTYHQLLTEILKADGVAPVAQVLPALKSKPKPAPAKATVCAPSLFDEAM